MVTLGLGAGRLTGSKFENKEKLANLSSECAAIRQDLENFLKKSLPLDFGRLTDSKYEKQRKLAKEVTLNVLYKALLLTMKKAC